MPTDTPTVEQMVRKIAEWMGFKSTGEWDDSKGLVVAGSWFGPHSNKYDSAADRERCMLAVIKKDPAEWVRIARAWALSIATGEVPGLAFTICLCRWIQAKESGR